MAGSAEPVLAGVLVRLSVVTDYVAAEWQWATTVIVMNFFGHGIIFRWLVKLSSFWA